MAAMRTKMANALFFWAETLQLGENDAILVINATNQDYSVVASGPGRCHQKMGR